MSRLPPICLFFFFNDTATTEIYTLSLHDALPIYLQRAMGPGDRNRGAQRRSGPRILPMGLVLDEKFSGHRKRSEEHTSELQSQSNLVCRLLLEKKIIPINIMNRCHF